MRSSCAAQFVAQLVVSTLQKKKVIGRQLVPTELIVELHGEKPSMGNCSLKMQPNSNFLESHTMCKRVELLRCERILFFPVRSLCALLMLQDFPSWHKFLEPRVRFERHISWQAYQNCLYSNPMISLAFGKLMPY